MASAFPGLGQRTDPFRNGNRPVLEPLHSVAEPEELDELVHGPSLVSRQAEVELTMMELAAERAIDAAESAEDIGPFLVSNLKRVQEAPFEKLKYINRPE